MGDEESEKPEVTRPQPLDQSRPPPRPQTGVKGVIEDFNEFKKFGSNYRGGKTEIIDESDDSDFDLSDEDQIFEKYKENKMKELKNKNSNPTSMKEKNSRDQNTVQDLTLETYEEASNSEGTVFSCLYSKS